MIQKNGWKFKVVDFFDGTILSEGYTFAAVVIQAIDKYENLIPESIKVVVVDEKDQEIQEIEKSVYTKKKTVSEAEAKEFLSRLKAKINTLDNQPKEKELKLLSMRCDVTASEAEQVQQYLSSTEMAFKTTDELMKQIVVLEEKQEKK